MHISSAAFMLIIAGSAGIALGQAAPGPPPATGVHPQAPASPGARSQAPANQPQTAPSPLAPAPVNPPSTLVKPSLAAVQDMLNNLRMDRWKKGSVRDEASDHVNSLLKDMQSNLPPLITAADATPASVSASIPLVKHLDAFYDVLLRVEEAARVSAPPEQISALQQTMLQLNQARLALDDHLQTQSVTQEKRVIDLEASLKVQQQAVAQAKAQAVTAATPQPCKPPAPVKKKPAAKKTSATTTPATTTPAPSTPSTTSSQKPPASKPASGQPQGQQNQPPGQKSQQSQPQGQKPPQ